jgi:hypothetical protein
MLVEGIWRFYFSQQAKSSAACRSVGTKIVTKFPQKYVVFYVHVTVCRNKFLCNETNWMHQFHKFILSWNSTCFCQTNCLKYVELNDKINLWNWCIQLVSLQRNVLLTFSLEYSDSPTLKMETSYFSEVCHTPYNFPFSETATFMLTFKLGNE